MQQKLEFMLGIVRGIFHLHSEQIVHRDLATRNVLLAADLTPKVCDFGMSRHLGNSNADTTKNDVGPLKWMAPEAIAENIYSFKTDIYSFGVVCWEILSCTDPYPDLTPGQVAARVVTSDFRLTIPDDCPEPLAKLMKQCWLKSPDERPDSKQLCIDLYQIAFGENRSVSSITTSSPKPSPIPAVYEQTPGLVRGEEEEEKEEIK